MKRLLFLLFCALTLNLFAQDTKPTNPEFKMLQSPNTPIFWYNPVDSFVWVYKGTYGWTRLLGETRASYKYVPYNGATKQVDLGYQRITSKKQLLPLFNGACSIPTILDNGDGSITVGDGEYHLSTRTDGKGTESFLISGGVFSLTDNTTNYLVADYNSGTPILKVITDVNLINETTVIPIYTAYRSGTTLHFQNWDALGVALANKVHQSIVKTQRYRRESGLGISEFPTRYLSIGNGKVWVGAVPVTLDAITTNTDNLRLYYHSGGVWTVSVQSQYNNTQYDNGTDLVTLTANRYAVNWLFRGVESQKHLYVVLGRGDYTLTQAQEAVLPAIPTAISSHAMLIGKFIVQRGATTATSIQSAFDVQFSTATPNAHNDLTGRDVADVHPAGSITFTPTGTYTATTVADALAQIDSKTVDRSTTNEIQAPTLVGDLIGLTQTTTTISIAGKEDKSNKVTSISGSSTDTQYPSARLLYDQLALKAPASGSGSYIWNETSPQMANYNISGYGIHGDYIQATTAKLTNLSDGYIPYHISDASGLGNSPIYTDGTNVGIGYSTGTEITNNKLAVNGNGYFNGTLNSTGYLLNGNNLFGSLSSNVITKWDGTKMVNAASNASGFLKNDGSGNFTFESPAGSTNLSYSTTTNTVTVISDTGTDAILPAATQSNAGILNTVDKTKIDNIWNTSVQSLSGTTPTWNVQSGLGATITLSGNTTITLSNLAAGMSGTIFITNPSTAYYIKFAGYTVDIKGSGLTIDSSGILCSGGSKRDSFGWYWNGATLEIHVALDYTRITWN